LDVGVKASGPLGEKRIVTFHPGKEMEVREFVTLSSRVSSMAPSQIICQQEEERCCLIQWCMDLCDRLRGQPQEEDDMLDEESTETNGFDLMRSRTTYDGYLWKLGSSRRGDDWGNLLSWRRRQFYLTRDKEALALMYNSEKENGVLQISCMLASKDSLGNPNEAAKVRWLDRTLVKPMEDDIKERVISDLQFYDTAINQMRVAYDYSRDVPTEIHPFAIEWFNEDGESEQIILTGGNERTSKRWMFALTKSLQQIAIAYEEQVAKKSSFFQRRFSRRSLKGVRV